MKILRYILSTAVLLLLPLLVFSQNSSEVDSVATNVDDSVVIEVGDLVEVSTEYVEEEVKEEPLDVKGIIFDHLADSYSWHITTINGHHKSIYLPCIVKSEFGWVCFSSKMLNHGRWHKGLYISKSGKYAGKIVHKGDNGEEVRPLDFSITKNAFAVMFNSTLLVLIFLLVARWYKRRPKFSVPGGLVGMIESVVMYIEDEVIVKSVGEDYRRYSPYLLTAFFFILFNNLMGLIPIFPGGANVTGNIAVTLALALCTMIAINVFGNKEYWKEILWPDVPTWMKAPIPLMPVIELFGLISKPFALTVRLFANIFAGHAIILSITCMIFISFKIGIGIGSGMTAFSVILSVFMLCLEMLVAFIQAYVFTMLSAVFIGQSRPKHHQHPKEH